MNLSIHSISTLVPRKIVSICQQLRLATLLLPLLLFLVSSAGAHAQFSYVVNSGCTSVTVTGYTGSDTVVTIPSTISVSGTSLPVTSIGNDWWPTGQMIIGGPNFASLTSVTIPSSVTNIGQYAFGNCAGLTSVTIPSSVTNIGLYAFGGCSGLTSVTIPNSVTSIGTYAFSGCIGLTSLTIPNSVTSFGDYPFSSCTGLISIALPSLPCGAFKDCTGLTSIMIPDSVTSIPFEAFSGCTSLANITISGNITSIGQYAFSGCSGLTSVTIPNSVTSIGTYAFSGCSGLANLTIPNSITSIGQYTFSGCSGLTNVTIPGSVTSIGMAAFAGCYSLTSVTIPNSVTDIGEYAFGGCSDLISINFMGNAPTTMGPNVFWATANGFAVYYFNNATGFGSSPWTGYATVKLGYTTANGQVTITSGSGSAVSIPGTINGLPVTSVGNAAFQNCGGLMSVIIPSSVTSVGDYAFANCDILKNAVFMGNAPSMGSSVFDSAANDFIVYYADSATDFASPIWNGYPSQTDASPKITSNPTSQTVTSGNTVTLVAAASGIPVPTVQWQWSTTGTAGPFNNIIGNPASITGTLTMSNVTAAQNGAYRAIFSNAVGSCTTTAATLAITPLTTGTNNGQITITGYIGLGPIDDLAIPDTINGLPVTSIGDNVFHGCPITTVTLPSGLIRIGNGAFSGCEWLTSVAIPSGVTSIGSGAFGGSYKLPYMTIPSSVTYIGSDAFDFCLALRSITVDGLNQAYCSIDGVLFDKNRTTLIKYPAGKSGSYIIPFGVASIENKAFDYCNGLTSVVIPSSVGSIGDLAFIECGSLTSVTIPHSVSSIGNSAFQYCTSLTSVIIPNSITRISGQAFDSCTSLKSVTIPDGVTSIGSLAFEHCTSLNSVVIPNSVTSIGAQAFYNCTSLASITIPNKVTSIGISAFEACSGLESVIFMGDAPWVGWKVFNSTASDFGVYYFDSAIGFTSPTWFDNTGHGWSAINMGVSSSISPWLISKGIPYDSDLKSAPNGDGVALLMKYALNLDPNRNESGSIPQPVIIGNNMSLTYYAGKAGITYTVESSTDLQTWSTMAVTVSGPDENNFYTATVPTTGPRRFMRLVVRY